jgi:hypothetical protein
MYETQHSHHDQMTVVTMYGALQCFSQPLPSVFHHPAPRADQLFRMRNQPESGSVVTGRDYLLIATQQLSPTVTNQLHVFQGDALGNTVHWLRRDQ